MKTELDAWLTFLACDDPVIIAKLITEYPKFKRFYEDAYYICENVERGMPHTGKNPECDSPI